MEHGPSGHGEWEVEEGRGGGGGEGTKGNERCKYILNVAGITQCRKGVCVCVCFRRDVLLIKLKAISHL